MYKAIMVAIALVLHAIYTWAVLANPVLENSFRDWHVFSLTQGGDKVCYISTNMKKEDGTFKRRGEPYLLVTYRGGGVAEISASSGYPYKDGSDVELNVDSGKYATTLFTSSDTPKVAWAKSAKADQDIIAAMRRGVNMTVKGYSRLNTHSIDTYSLLGFTKAFNRMRELCS